MSVQDIIARKRDGYALSQGEIEGFVRGSVDGSFADYQISALLMAITINGMDERETTDLTLAMAASGDTMDLSAIPGIKVDKHSTGGVGDTTTLILAPLVAACGVPVAKMSGRGLGHTGGTVDKLEAVPGVRMERTPQELIRMVNAVGCAVVGQSGELAPADKKLYALRDVTATVKSIPLIVSSILSKKFAAGCDAVVLDVKSGSGAIMPTLEESIELARAMVKIGELAGKRMTALVTDMDQPLGMYVGNALEVEEAIDVLAGRTGGPLRDVSLLLGAKMLICAGRAGSDDEARAMLIDKLESGEGLGMFSRLIEALGGDGRVAYDTSLLPKAKRLYQVTAERSGYVSGMDTAQIGVASQMLGAGRQRQEDVIDPAVGLVMRVRVGDSVKAGDVIATLHVNDEARLEEARAAVAGAVRISGEKAPPPLVHAIIDRDGMHKAYEV